VNVVRQIEVAVDPETAFRLFTEEMPHWYRSGHHSWNDPEQAVGIRFEPGLDGRWVEVWDEETGEGYEIGRVLEWEPGVRFVVSYRNVNFPPEPTRLEVRFDPAPGGTRVRLEHSELVDISERMRENAWVNFIGWYRDYVAEKCS
jgi:hypothetical protein